MAVSSGQKDGMVIGGSISSASFRDMCILVDDVLYLCDPFSDCVQDLRRVSGCLSGVVSSSTRRGSTGENKGVADCDLESVTFHFEASMTGECLVLAGDTLAESAAVSGVCLLCRAARSEPTRSSAVCWGVLLPLGVSLLGVLCMGGVLDSGTTSDLEYLCIG